MIMELTRPEQDAQIHRPHKRQWPLRRRHQELVFPSGIHIADAQCFGTRHLKPPLVLEINKFNSSPVDKFIINRSIFGGGGGTAWKCDLLSNFCGETGDDSAPGLKSSSFKRGYLSFTLASGTYHFGSGYFGIGSASRVLTDAAPTPIPIPRMRFDGGEPYERIREKKKFALHRSRTPFNLIQGSTLE